MVFAIQLEFAAVRLDFAYWLSHYQSEAPLQNCLVQFGVEFAESAFVLAFLTGVMFHCQTY